MNKKLIAIAVAAALVPAAAMAEVTVYGRGHLSVDAYSGNSGDSTSGTKNGLNLTSNSSRLGFKGAEELGGGLKGVFQLETSVDVQGGSNQSMFGGQRDTYLGVAGDFGTVIGGRLPLANQWAYDANFFGDKVGDAAEFAGGGFGGNGLLGVPGRVNRAIAYVSPSLGGVTVLAAFVPNTQQSLGAAQNSANKQSSYTLRGSYDSNGIFAAASIANIGVAGVNLITDGTASAAVGVPGLPVGVPPVATALAGKDGKVTIMSLAGGFEAGAAKLRAQYVQSKADSAAAGAEVKQTVIVVGGQFKLNAADSISAQIAKAGDISIGGSSAAKSGATLLAVGYDHALSKNTTVYVAYAKVSNNDNAQFSGTGYGHGGVGAPGFDTSGKAASPSSLSVGLTRDF
jgi:predicted porin